MLTLTLTGRVPSKKNSKIVICTNNKPRLLPSKKYQEWHEEKMWELKAQDTRIIENIKRIEIILYAPDKRKADLTNKAESLMDLLVDIGIIKDDNWFVVSELILKFGGVDKNNPRAIIKLL